MSYRLAIIGIKIVTLVPTGVCVMSGANGRSANGGVSNGNVSRNGAGVKSGVVTRNGSITSNGAGSMNIVGTTRTDLEGSPRRTEN